MDITDFRVPTEHPVGMLAGYINASEKEHALCYILTQCINAGDFIPVKTVFEHSSIVKDGLLDEIDTQTYKLTIKSIGLLYSYYGVEADTEKRCGRCGRMHDTWDDAQFCCTGDYAP